MFISRRAEIRYGLIRKAIMKWNRDIAPVPFYRKPTIFEVAFLAGVCRIKSYERDQVWEDLKQEVI